MKRKKTIWTIVAPVKRGIIYSMSSSVISSIFTVLNLIFLVYLITSLYEGETRQMLYYLLSMLGCTVLAYVCRLNSYNLSHYAAFKLESVLRKKIATHLAQLPLGYLTETGAGTLGKIINDDVRALHGFVGDSIPLFARAYFYPVFTFACLLCFDYRMALIALLILVFGLFLLKLAMGNTVEANRKYNESREEISVAIIEYVQAMPEVRIFDGGEKSFRRYDNALGYFKQIVTGWYKENGLSAKIAMLVLNPLPTFIILLTVGILFYKQGSLGLPQLLASLLLGTGMIESIMPLRSLSHVTDRSNMSADRIDELLSEEVLTAPEKGEQPTNHAVTFEQVSFTYPHREEKALDMISFGVPEGSFTALVGASGSGKSTTAKLIPRFWDVDSGAIKIGGVDIRKMDNETLMSTIAFVFQENVLFSDTIENNIRLGSPTASEEEVVAAAKAAQAHEFILQLPEGYQSNAGERGGMLSGGQKQRIAIARAILQNRPILILDEPTSFSDTENEALLMKALQQLIKNKTVIMIAHRLANIKAADQILVLDKGHLIATGKHEELIARPGIYSEMWKVYEETRTWHINSLND